MSDDLEKRITAKYVLDSTGFNNSLKGINSQLANNKAQLALASEGLKTFGANSEKLKGVQQALAQQLDLHSKKVDVWKNSIEKTTSKMQENIKERDRLKQSLIEEGQKHNDIVKAYGKESEEAQRSRVSLKALGEEYKNKGKQVESNAKQVEYYNMQQAKAQTELTKTQGALNKVNKELAESNNKWLKASDSLKKSSEGLKSAGAKISSVGDGILKATAPLVAFGVAGSKMSMDFEDSMAKVSTISDDTQVPIDDLRKQIIKLSNDSGVEINQLTNTVYDALSAGQQTADVMGFVEKNTRLAKAGFAGINETLDLTTTIMNSYGLEAKEIDRVSNILITTQNLGKTTVAQLSSTMGKAIPTANAFGVNLENLSTGLAVLTAKGIATSESVTYISSMLNELGKSGTTASDVLKNATGKSFQQLMKDGKSLGDVIASMDAYAKKNKKSLADMFGSAEAGKAALVLSTNAGEDFNKVLLDMQNSAGATDTAFDKVSNTAGDKFRKNLNRLKNEGIKLGDAIAPLLEKGSELMGTLTDKLSGMSEEQLQNYAKWTLMAVGVGGFLKVGGGAISTIGSIVGAVGKLTSVLGTATVATEGVGVASGITGGAGGLGALVGGLSAVALPALAVVGAVGAVGLACYGIHKTLSEEVVPSIDLFADKIDRSKVIMTEYGEVGEVTVTKISESTKKAVGAYMELDKKVSDSLHDMRIHTSKSADEIKADMVYKFYTTSNLCTDVSKEMKDKITKEFANTYIGTKGFSEQIKNDMVAKMQQMLNSSSMLSQQQKEKILADYQAMYSNSGIVTESWKTDMITKYSTMSQQIKDGLKQKQDEQITDMQDYFFKSNALTVEEEAKITQANKDGWEGRKGAIDVYTKEINTIIGKAYEEHRTLKDEEVKRINELQGLMKEEAVKSLSETELESKIILERIKQNSERLTAEQASDTVKKANETRDKTIQAAEEEYNKRLGWIIKQRDESKTISADQAQKLIDEAERTRKESIQKANDTCEGIKNEIEKNSPGIWDKVDKQNGGILTRMSNLKKKIGSFFNWLYEGIKDGANALENLGNESNQKIPQHWTGTQFFQGGFTTMHEKGWELYNLPRGSKIYNHEASEELVKQTAESVATKVANSVLKNFQGTGQNNITIEVPLYLDGREVARASARYMNEELGYQNKLAWRR